MNEVQKSLVEALGNGDPDLFATIMVDTVGVELTKWHFTNEATRQAQHLAVKRFVQEAIKHGVARLVIEPCIHNSKLGLLINEGTLTMIPYPDEYGSSTFMENWNALGYSQDPLPIPQPTRQDTPPEEWEKELPELPNQEHPDLGETEYPVEKSIPYSPSWIEQFAHWLKQFLDSNS